MSQIKAHSTKIEEITKTLETSLESGLTEKEAQSRLLKFGKNELTKKKGKSAWQILIDQFNDFLVYLLFFAIVISIIIGVWEASKPDTPSYSSEYTDAIVIAAILIVNAILGFYQEYEAEKSLDSLQKLAPHNATVRREGIVQVIEIENLVPGDIVLFEDGDKFPADIRLFQEFSLYVDEAILTGESKPVKKKLDLVDEKMILADRTNLGYMNTIITRGSGEGIVIGTGMNTEMGKIAESLQKEVFEPSPFQKEVDRFGKQLGIIILIICAIVFITEILIIAVFDDFGIQEDEMDTVINAFQISISLAVSAVPEGLIVVITVVMSIGMRKMADRNALVRKLTAVETLGRVNIICSDKTGTLTKNEMTVVKIFINNKVLDVEGVGFNVIGNILEDGKPIAMGSDLIKFLEVCLYCNHANVNIVNELTGEDIIVGDPTEISMKILALKGKIDHDFEKLDEIPFNSDRKMMTVVGKKEGKIIAYIKGAPDVLMRNTSKVLINGVIEPIEVAREKILKQNEEFAEHALRVLGVAYKELEPNFDINDVEKDFTYIGLVGIIDPPRDEVGDAILQARAAGIRTIMITGDHKITAIAIAKQIGLANSNEAITGMELESMSDNVLAERIKTVDIFARVASEQKFRICKLLMDHDNIVAMTGDGVNDAPAVNAAHVGIAMGIAGTEVTYEASEMILIDDNFATIVSAIEEGRGIFATTKNFFRYMLSTNFDEIFMILFAYLIIKLTIGIFFALPVTPLQILWLNIATDGIPAMVLGLTPTDPDVMEDNPREGFTLIKEIKGPVLILGIYTAITDILLYVLLWTVLIPYWSTIDPMLAGYQVNGSAANLYAIQLTQTIIFTNLVICELLFVFSCTSNTKPFYKWINKHLFWAVGLSLALQLIVLYTPLGVAFGVVPLTQWYHWAAVVLGAFSVFVFDELRKWRLRAKKRKSLLFNESPILQINRL